jgi:Arc/MetJ-type ribon-helix-helix transcriptional regulator
MATLNVRLSEEDARLARRLRERGRSVSEIVRAALRAEARHENDSTRADPAAVLSEMKRRFPIRKGETRAPVDTTNRKKVRAAIRRKLAPR